MAVPIKPTVPPAPLRSQPETFSARAEASVVFWGAFATYLDDIGVFTEEQANNALAAALGGSLPPLTGQALKFLRVNAGETAGEFAAVQTDLVVDTTPQLGGTLDTNAHTIKESIGTAQASATSVTPPTNGNIFHITGTTTVAGFANGAVGQRYTIIPDGVFSLTNSSTLVIEGAADYTTVAGTSFEIIQDTATVWRVKVPPASVQTLIVVDQKASGTAGQSMSATTWNKHLLGTVKANTITGASVATSQITLPAGTYDVTGFAIAHRSNLTAMRLRDTTGSVDLALGTNAQSHSSYHSSHTVAFLDRFTISATSAIELQVNPQTAYAMAAHSKQIEVYAKIKFTKVG